MTGKAAYVVSEARKPRSGKHHCHWPGCERAVPPSMWGCRKHWGMLPMDLRRAIWKFFEPGQEITKTPSRAYVEVARQVQEWIRDHGEKADVREGLDGLAARLGDGTPLDEPAQMRLL